MEILKAWWSFTDFNFIPSHHRRQECNWKATQCFNFLLSMLQSSAPLCWGVFIQKNYVFHDSVSILLRWCKKDCKKLDFFLSRKEITASMLFDCDKLIKIDTILYRSLQSFKHRCDSFISRLHHSSISLSYRLYISKPSMILNNKPSKSKIQDKTDQWPNHSFSKKFSKKKPRILCNKIRNHCTAIWLTNKRIMSFA